MSSFATNEDLQFFMNCLSAQNLVLRALLKENPKVADQLELFVSTMPVENQDMATVVDEVRKLLPK